MPGWGSVVRWQRVGVDSVTVDGDNVTAEGEFARIIDNQPSDQTDPGTLHATCSPNSVGP
jgi:hypothetical protein